jgi:cytochrome P450
MVTNDPSKRAQAAADEVGTRTESGGTLMNPHTASCPFSYYTRLRRDAPVRRDPEIGYYWVTRRSDVRAAALDWNIFRSKSDLQLRKSFQPKAQKLWEEAGFAPVDTLVTSDPPEHDDYRRLGITLFSPAKVEELTPSIEAMVNELIDAFIDAGKCEFVRQFASLLPATVVCDEYGFPREDRAQFKHWTDAVIKLQTPGLSEEEEVELTERLIALYRYLARYLQDAADRPSDRVIHTIATMNKHDGTPFSWLERASMVMAVFVGGNETTVNTLASCILTLATRPELQRTLRAEPSLVENFVEEILRLEPSVQALVRLAHEDTELAGTTIPAGSPVILCTGSANRDETYWTDPDELRLDRDNARQHYTFGYGRHSCVGMHLARRELTSAVRILLRRLDNIRLQNPDAPQYEPLPFFRALAEVPIAFDKR